MREARDANMPLPLKVIGQIKKIYFSSQNGYFIKNDANENLVNKSIKIFHNYKIVILRYCKP